MLGWLEFGCGLGAFMVLGIDRDHLRRDQAYIPRSGGRLLPITVISAQRSCHAGLTGSKQKSHSSTVEVAPSPSHTKSSSMTMSISCTRRSRRSLVTNASAPFAMQLAICKTSGSGRPSRIDFTMILSMVMKDVLPLKRTVNHRLQRSAGIADCAAVSNQHVACGSAPGSQSN